MDTGFVGLHSDFLIPNNSKEQDAKEQEEKRKEEVGARCCIKQN